MNVSKSKSLLTHAELNKEQSLLFWKEKLADIEPLDLSFLRCNEHSDLLINSRQTPELSIREIRFSFSMNTLFKLDKLRKKYKITPYLYGQSILAVLLNKYTDQDRFCISSSVAIKGEEGFPYEVRVNTNVIPYDFSKIDNIIDVMNQSREFLKALEQDDVNHSYLPISEILAVSNKDLINISFVEINLEDRIVDFDNKNAKINNYTNIELDSDLVFEQDLSNKGVNYNIRYKLDKITSNLLSEFIICYKKLFIEILDELFKNKLSSELTYIKNYTLLSPEQYEQIINTWNDTDKVCLRDKTINRVFEEQVERTPENIAIVYEETKLTYKDLNERANRLASYLKQNYNIKPDTLIALCLDRNEHMFIAMIAILKAGGAYVPINPSYPDERIEYILEDTDTKLILTNELYKKRMCEISKVSTTNLTNLESIPATEQKEILILDNVELQDRLLLRSKENLGESLVKSNNLAYVIYTSGTTGKPKGVMIEHRSYVATIDYMKTLCFTDKQQISTYSITNYAFDMMGPEYGLPLFSGGKIHIGNNDFDCLDCSPYDFIQITPTLCDLKLDCLINTDRTKLFVGAESLSRDLLVKILNRSIDVVHFYGPTETTVWSTSKYYSAEEDTNLLSVVLGKPFDGEKVYVLDSNLNPLPIGAIGELYIGGIGLARGYLNKRELTAEKFIPNPFQTQEEKAKNKNTRLYKTGDLVRWLPSGNLEYIGRNDFQVKIRGYRIELGEIENALLSYDGIKQSVILAKERLSKDGSPTGHKYLVGYYVSDSKLDETGILNYLQSRLPEYMVPNTLMHLSTLPLTVNGKLDRKAFPDPESVSNERYIAPRNEEENQLCNIWTEVLGLPEGKVSIHDDFFRLGGDSILAIRLVSKINKEFKSQLKVRDILEMRCISKLVDFINSTHNIHKELESYTPFSLVKLEDYKNDIQDIDLIEDIYPASYLQMGMLLESNLDNNDTYNNISSYRVHHKLDKDKLLFILNCLVNKNELLRAAFVLNNENGWNVIVFKSIKLDYKIYKNRNSKELIAKEKLNNFDYTKPSLFRVIINDLGDHFDLIFSFHHAIEDGWSFATFINELGQAYVNNKPIETKLDLRYGEFVQNELAAINNQDTIAFWKKYLNDSNVTKVNWKFDKEKAENRIYNSLFILNNEQVSEIHKISRDLEISVDVIFLFAYLKTLSFITNNSDVSVGLMVNNRLEKEEGDKLFGLFLNTIPFRFNLNNQKDGLDGLLELFNMKLNLQKYKQLPYGYIKSLFKYEPYDFVFNFVHLHILSEVANSVESVDGYERIDIPFSLTVAQKGDHTFLWNISAHDDFISKDFLDYFATYYKECLNYILKDPNCRLDLIEKDYQKIITSSNQKVPKQRTFNGKRNIKISSSSEATSADTAYFAPRNERERKVCHIWAEALNLSSDKVGIHDDFFKLGGNSILAIKLISRLNNYCKCNLKVSDIFLYSSIELLLDRTLQMKESSHNNIVK